VKSLLNKLDGAARSGENLMPVILSCCENYATLGEIADTLRNVFGEHKA
jgi:methylmalonyl-CoA mutase N-terminal domain/subunit